MLNALVKDKQTPGKARPTAAGRQHRPAEVHKEFRKLRPYRFVAKLIMMVACLTVFGVGVFTTDPATKQAAASLVALGPLVCGIETLLRNRCTLVNHLKSISGFFAYGLVASFFVLAAFTVPTFVCQFGIGAMVAHGTELAHQSLHKKGTGKRVYDSPIGLVLCGASFVSFHRYVWTHLRHHRLNGTAQDSESFDYAYDFMDSPSRWRRLLGLFLHLSLLVHYISAIQRMALAGRGVLRARLLAEYPDMGAKVAKRIEREYQVHLLLVLAVIVLSLCFQTTLILKLWIIPILVGWGPCHSLIETTEHWHTERPNEDVFRNTRSLRAGLFAQWYTNWNNCHVGHHHDMSVPADSLPAYEAKLAESNNFSFMEESYPTFYRRFFRHIWTGKCAA